MKETRYFYVPEAETRTELPDEEAKHATRVLRLDMGDEMFLVDGSGTLCRAEVTAISNKHCLYRIVEATKAEATWHGKISLAIAPTKMMDRIEWMAEKATEIGIDEISFLDCKFSERKSIRTDRVERIVVSAMKQSHKTWKPAVNEMLSFKDFVDVPRPGNKYIAHCYNEVERKDLLQELQTADIDAETTILVGPEGDFSIDEVRYALSKGFISVSLGQSRLRTETAGLFAVMMANTCKRKL